MTMQPKNAPKKNKGGSDSDPSARRIRELNDRFRRSFAGGRIMLTNGVLELGPSGVAAVLGLVRAFDSFAPGCDPYQEHDFGSVLYAGEQLFWKIDYYDASLQFGSPDPADPAVTTRVMSIMLATEY
jgi:hypothetical protein